MSLHFPEDSKKPIHLLEVAGLTEILSKGVMTFNITERSGSQLYWLRSFRSLRRTPPFMSDSREQWGTLRG
jgi:hypothetical protein